MNTWRIHMIFDKHTCRVTYECQISYIYVRCRMSNITRVWHNVFIWTRHTAYHITHLITAPHIYECVWVIFIFFEMHTHHDAHTHIRTHIHIDTLPHTHTHTDTHTHKHARSHTHTRARAHTHTHKWRKVTRLWDILPNCTPYQVLCQRTMTHTLSHTHTHTRARAHTHTHTHT